MKKFLVLLFLLVASHAMAMTAKQNLMDLLRRMHTLQAHFSQVLQDQQGNIAQNSEGKLALVRPGKFYWQIDQPSKQIILTNGKVVWTYDVDLEQAVQQPLSASNQRSPAYLLAGSERDLAKQYAVQAIPPEAGATTWFLLKPLDQQMGLFQSVKIGFNGDEVARLIIADNLGQISQVKLTDIKLNQPLNSSLFEFQPPQGVDVIINR